VWLDVVSDPRDGVAFVRVADTGRGIPADKLDSIFEPFTQVDSSHSREGQGTGLGLTISRDLARGMGGDLRVRSEPGVGSVFTVTLRLA
jgi:signal transduction histidine kinase